MITEFQMETVVHETASMAPIALGDSASALVSLDDNELECYSGGARDAGSSRSDFSRNRMAVTRGTWANAQGSGTFESIVTEELDTSSAQTWDICQ